MSRARPDPHEVYNTGPLFARNDPQTSVQAAARAIASGTVKGDAAMLLRLVHDHPGKTMEWYGAWAAAENGGDPFLWRIKLGRRTGPLIAARLIHQRGEEDGKGLWWPE